jgi:hypothetical protein
VRNESTVHAELDYVPGMDRRPCFEVRAVAYRHE